MSSDAIKQLRTFKFYAYYKHTRIFFGFINLKSLSLEKKKSMIGC